MENRDFDKLIKEGLENIHTSFQPDDWDSMEQALDQQDILADNHFDQFVKNGLGKVTPVYHATEWSSMEQLLDQQAVLADGNFDDFVKTGLQQATPTYHSNEWTGMESLLNKKEKERKELVYIKGIEFILVILAALILYMFFPFDNHQIQGSPFDDNLTPIISIIDTEESTNSKSVDSKEVENNTLANNELSSSALPNTHSSNQKSNYSKESTLINQYDINYHVNDINTSITNIPSILKNAHSISNHLPIITNNEEIANSIADKEELTDLANISNNDIVKESLVLLEPISTLSEDVLHFDKPDLKLAINKSKPEVRISYQLGVDRNHVFTAYDSDTESSFKQGNYGFSAGVKASVRKGRFEFETGLAYIKKQYNPSPIYQITGNVKEGYEAETLKKLNFNIISVPLDLRFYLKNTSSKWNFYITSGAALNTVAWSNYDRYTYTVENTSNPQNLTEGRGPKQKNIQKAGLFYGESFKDNYYITASLGFGTEVQLDQRVSFFTQPKFTYYLLPGNIGLGPNNDHFNTISVDLGLRFKL